MGKFYGVEDNFFDLNLHLKHCKKIGNILFVKELKPN